MLLNKKRSAPGLIEKFEKALNIHETAILEAKANGSNGTQRPECVMPSIVSLRKRDKSRIR
jgi:hypothetical protein